MQFKILIAFEFHVTLGTSKVMYLVMHQLDVPFQGIATCQIPTLVALVNLQRCWYFSFALVLVIKEPLFRWECPLAAIAPMMNQKFMSLKAAVTSVCLVTDITTLHLLRRLCKY